MRYKYIHIYIYVCMYVYIYHKHLIGQWCCLLSIDLLLSRSIDNKHHYCPNKFVVRCPVPIRRRIHYHMMTSSNGNIFRVTGHLCREFTGPRWILLTEASALMFSLICAWINGWVNNRKAGDLRRNRAHYDVSVMTLLWYVAGMNIVNSEVLHESFILQCVLIWLGDVRL